MKVLIIDDDEQWRATLSALLQDVNPTYDVTVATSGVYVLRSDWSTISTFDRIISDTRMPGATGIEVLQYLQTRGWKKTFLLLSSESTTERGFDLETVPIIFSFAQFCIKDCADEVVRRFLA